MKYLHLLLILATFPVFAEFKKNPDEGTLWLEDGVNISGWSKGLLLEAHPEAGFTISPGEGYASGRYVPADPKYPWFTYEIVGYSMMDGYRGFVFSGSLGMVANPQTGIFATKRVTEGNTSYLRFDLHGLKIHFKYLKQVSKPDYYIETKRMADKLDVRVFLKKPAEDVMVRFYDAYHVSLLRLNNEDKLQLLPTDEENPLEWCAEIPYPEIKTQGAILLKALILGGEIKVPLWGKLEP